MVGGFNETQVGCSAVMTAKDIAENAQWEDPQLCGKIKGIEIIPKFSATPGKIWRGSVPLGYDNDLVSQHHFGMYGAELDRLREQGII